MSRASPVAAIASGTDDCYQIVSGHLLKRGRRRTGDGSEGNVVGVDDGNKPGKDEKSVHDEVVLIHFTKFHRR